MDKILLKAVKRDITGKQVKAMRRQGELPAVIYGRHLQPIAITLNAHDAGLTLGRTTSSSLVTIELDGKEYPTLVREKQRNYIKGELTHVDFLAVSLTEKIRAGVRIELTGVSTAVKDYNAVLVRSLEELEVECLPTDLPGRFTVDISVLTQVGDGVRVGDISVSENVRILNDPEEMIVVTTAAREEEVAAPAAEAEVVTPGEPELAVERGKKEEEEEEK